MIEEKTKEVVLPMPAEQSTTTTLEDATKQGIAEKTGSQATEPSEGAVTAENQEGKV